MLIHADLLVVRHSPAKAQEVARLVERLNSAGIEEIMAGGRREQDGAGEGRR